MKENKDEESKECQANEEKLMCAVEGRNRDDKRREEEDNERVEE